MRQTESVTAILTKAADYRENDRLVRLFTVEGGMRSAVIKGVKKASAKLKFAAQPFAFCQYELAKRGGYYTITNATQLESLFAVTADADKYIAGCILLEVSDNAVDEIANPQLFIKLLKALKALVYGETNAYLVCLKYVLAALDEQGYRNAYEGGTPMQTFLRSVQYAPLDKLGELCCTQSQAVGALKSVCKECELHFDKRVQSASLLP